jgi:hypothetical protein
VTFNGGKPSELDATAQFYHVSVDNDFRIIFMVLNRTILPFVSLLDLVVGIGPESWYLQVAKQDISKPNEC